MISFTKVILSLINIFIFRFTFEIVQDWILNGMAGFFLTIYIINNLQTLILKLKKSIKKKLNQPKPNEIGLFDAKNLSSFELEYVGLRKIAFEYDLNHRCKRDLFSLIFNSGANSVFLNFSTILIIEYIHNKYDLNIPISIFYCVSATVIIIFGSSYRYSDIIARECLKLLDSKRVNGWVCVFHRSSDETKKDLVCIWTCLFESERNEKIIECKFLSSKYSSNLNEIIDHYASKYMKLETFPLPKLQKDNEQTDKKDDLNKPEIKEYKSENVEKENYNLLWPDYYDIGMASSNKIKAIGFKLATAWNEFNFFPGIKFKINSFSNKNINGKKNN